MASSVPNSPWLCSLKPTKTSSSCLYLSPRSLTFKPINSSSSSDNSSEPQKPVVDPVKLAFEKAKSYKKSKTSTNPVVIQKPESVFDDTNDASLSSDKSVEPPVLDPVRLAFEKSRAYKESKTTRKSVSVQQPADDTVNKFDRSELGGAGGKTKEGADVFRVAMEKAKDYAKTKGGLTEIKGVESNEGIPDASLSSDISVESPVLDPVKLAFEKSRAYKESKTNTKPVSVQQPAEDTVNKFDRSELGGAGGKSKEGADVFRVAMEKAKDYGKTKGGLMESKGVGNNEGIPGSKGGTNELSRVEKRAKKEKMTVSSIDFVGLNFSDKRSSRGLPPGLVPMIDPFSDTDEVEIIVGDTSKFEATTKSNPTTVDENQDVYKPKVSTWGVFPRPSNISKTYGGGKVIRPGETLETAEDKAAKEARTRQLLAAYKKKVGLNIDPKLKSECQKVLNDGDLLMDRGMLKEALPFYESVMDKLPFQTELHGLAALQWSICQDSLTRNNEARVMYEKLQSHPNVRVRKQARDFVFGFQAMEMLKVKRSTPSPTSTGYQNYFDAFVKDKTTYSQEQTDTNEGAISEVIPYMVFLCCPILIVLVIAVQKGI